MKRAKALLILFTLVLAIAWFLPGGMSAQDTNKAALVIRHSATFEEAKCVEFSEDEITGLQLLQRSGLDFGVDVQGLGALVCRIDQTGCSTDDCWCQCKGGSDCVYWSYWHQINGEWQYSQAGAAVYAVRDGDVDGWSWGPGAVNAAFPPPNLSFEEVCSQAAGNGSDVTPTSSPTTIVFMPQSTPQSKSTQVRPTQTATTAPTFTTQLIIPTIAETRPAPTSTMVPTATAVFAAEAVAEAEAPAQPAAPAGPSQVPSPDVVSYSVVESRPDVMSSATDTADIQPTPLEIAVVPEVVATTVQQAPEEEPGVVIMAPPQQTPGLTVVGSGFEVKDLQVHRSGVAGQATQQVETSAASSPMSYAIFAAIMLALTALFALSYARRKGQQGAHGEPRSRA